jgi:hypothetical protein
VRSECYVAVDFDGTCVTHKHEGVGNDIGADVWLRCAVKLGAKLILWTMRDGKGLYEAKDWFISHEVEIWNVNVNPDQAEWTKSLALYYHILIDDSALGTPLKAKGPRERPFVDWSVAGPALLGKVAGILNQ